jgi:hypothetical protein
VGSQGLQTGSQGAQETGSHGSQYEDEAVVIYTCCACVERATGKIEPLRHQLVKPPPLDEQPILMGDTSRATAQNKVNFFMI